MDDSAMWSYSKINKLTANELKDLCRQNGIGLQHSKSAKVALLCHVLGISTSGPARESFQPRERESGLTRQQLDEFAALNPHYVAVLQGWEKTLNKCPDLDDSTVKRYLLDTDVLSAVSSRKYKISRPYQLKSMVHSMNFHPLPDSTNFVIIRAQCNPSQSTNEGEVKSLYCILDKMSGTPYGGYCTCTAGYCQACGHIGATLFLLADIISSGVASIPPDATCTDVPCYWSKPIGAAVTPKTLSEIKVKMTPSTSMRCTRSQYGKRFMEIQPRPSFAFISKFKANVLSASHRLGKKVPGSTAMHSSRFNIQMPDIKNVQLLPDSLLELDPVLVPAGETEVETSPLPPIADLPNLKNTSHNVNNPIIRQALTDSLTFSKQDCDLIEEKTRGQKDCIEWYQQRRGCITSTRASDIVNIAIGTSNASELRLTRDCLGSRFAHITKPPRTTLPALNWGQNSEPKALEVYTRWLLALDLHESVQVHTSGLVTHPESPFLRASPDGIVRCPCHPTKLVEIKCPYVARNSSVKVAVAKKEIDYLIPAGKHYNLCKVKRGYYTQIQMCMAVTGIHTCDLVVWTTKSFAVIEVPFNEVYWTNIVVHLTDFFRDNVLPAIVSGSLRKMDIPRPDEGNSDEECMAALILAEDEMEVRHADSISSVTDDLLSNSPLATPLPDSDPHVSPLSNSPLATALPDSDRPVCPDTEGNPKRKLCWKKEDSALPVTLCRNRHCRKVLPEPDLISSDNSNASVQCECHCGCTSWYCWPCGNITEETADEDWFCHLCARKCQ